MGKEYYEFASATIAAKAKAERVYMHYALILASVMTIVGTALVILGLGDHLDILVKTDIGLEGRFINASPGVALWIFSVFIFLISKPRRLKMNNRTVREAEGLSSSGHVLFSKDKDRTSEDKYAPDEAAQSFAPAQSSVDQLPLKATNTVDFVVSYMRNDKRPAETEDKSVLYQSSNRNDDSSSDE